MLRLEPLLIFIFSFLFAIVSIGQTQITNIQNPVPTLKYNVHGIVNINGKDYLIETDYTSLRVTKVNEDSEVLYEVSDYPENDPISYYHGRYDTRSGYTSSDQFLYEVFTTQIRKRNLLTGEIVQTYDFELGQLSNIEKFEVTETMFHFELRGDYHFATYLFETEQYELLHFNKNATYRAKNIYYTGEEFDGIEVYNSENRTSTYQYNDIGLSIVSGNNIVNGKRGLVMSNYENSWFLNEDTTYMMNCIFSDYFPVKSRIRDSEEHYYFFSNSYDNPILKVRSKTDCSDIQIFNYQEIDDDYATTIFDSPTFNQDYIIFGVEDGYFGLSQLNLIDKETSNITSFDYLDFSRIDTQSFYRNGDELYFIANDNTDPYPTWYLCILNLQTKTIKTEPKGWDFSSPLSFGSSEFNNTLFLHNIEDHFINIYDFENNDNSELIYTSTDTRNFGPTNLRYLASDNHKLAFQFKNKIFFHNDTNISEPIFEVDEISKLKITDTTLEGLINDADTTYYLTYNYNTNALSKEFLGQNMELTPSIRLSNFLLGNFSVKDKTYFDLASKSFKDIPIDSNIISMHLSKDHVLFLTKCGSEYCLTSFVDGIFSEYEHFFKNEPEIYSKHNGTFLVLEPNSLLSQSLYAISGDGTHVDKITVHGKNLNKITNKIASGRLGALMFNDTDNEDLVVILQRDSKFQKFEIPFNNLGWSSLIFQFAGNSIIVKSRDETEPGIYICTLGKEVNKITENGIGFPNHKLLLAFENVKIISIILNKSLYDFEIISYDSEAEKVNFVKNVDLDSDFLYFFSGFESNTKFQLTDKTYFVTFSLPISWDDNENSEPFLFDAESITLEEGEDINLASQFSNPHNFFQNDDNLFFIARSPLDNSYQLFSQQKDLTTSIKKINLNVEKIKVMPNPSEQFVSISRDANQVKIYDTNGNLLLTKHNYSAMEKIKIAHFPKGLFYVESISGDKVSVGKFIKI